MVWVVHGNLNSAPDDAPDALPPPSSHLLRPSRVYKLGRLGNWAEREGKPKTKARLLDFRIKSLGISKEGAWELETGGWDETDDPSSPTNLAPYQLKLKLTMSSSTLHRATNPDPRGEVLPNGTVVQLEHGDRVQFGKWGSEMRFEWVPMVLCIGVGGISKKGEEAKEEVHAKARSAGFTISHSPPSPHHTHYLTSRSLPSYSLLRASILQLPILSPQYLDTLLSLTSCHPPTPEILSTLPDYPAPGRGEGEKELAKWEKAVLSWNPDVGNDWSRWWGHASLEKDWERKPDERLREWWPQSKGKGEQEMARIEKWEPTLEGRERLFEGVAVVSYRDYAEANSTESFILSHSSGHFLHSNLLSPSSNPAAAEVDLPLLLSEIQQFQRREGLGKETRWALLEPLDGAGGELLRELAGRLHHGKVHDSQDQPIVQAIYHNNVDSLFDPNSGPQDGAEVLMEEAGATPAGSEFLESSSRSRRQPTASGSLSTLPFPSAGVPGTHPDEEEVPTRSALRAREKGKGKGMGKEREEEGEEEEEEEMPSAAQVGQKEKERVVVKPKLQRFSRAASRAARDALFDDDDDDEGQQSSRRSTTTTTVKGRKGEIRTQELGATMEVDEEEKAPQSSAIPVRAPPAPNANRPSTLKRRARSQPSASLFDSSDDSDDAARTDARVSKKSREERVREIREEDERIAREEEEKARKRREEGLPVVEEEGEEEVVASVVKKGGPGGGGGKKRPAAATSGSEAEQAPPKSTKVKGKVVPVVVVPPARKRLRSTSVQPDDDDEEQEVPVATTSSSKKKAPTSKATGGGGKKGETAAQKKAAKEAQAQVEATLLQIKPKRTTNKSATAVDQAFTEDFNALKIVRPKLQAMTKPEKYRVGWNEVDPDEEMNRLIRDEQEARDDPDKWAGKATQMFVVHATQLARRERREPRRDLELEEKWKGRPNFKRFKPKNLLDPHHPQPQHKEHREPELVVPKPVAVDYGIGEGYRDKRKLVYQDDDEDEDDSDLDAGNSPKLNFKKLPKGKKAPVAAKAKAPAKGKGKKKVVSDSDDDDLDDVSTLNGRQDSDDEMLDLDSAEEAQSGKKKPSTSKAKAAKPKAASTSKRAAPAPAKRKPAPTMLVIDSDSDEEDGGLTFKGFGTKRKR